MTARRSGQVNGSWLAFLGSVLLFVALVGLLAWDSRRGEGPRADGPLLIHCAAGFRAPVEAIAREYEGAFGVPVRLQYGGSQTLLSGVEISRTGDLFLPADDSYIQMARQKDLIDEVFPLARFAPVLAVRKGNPLGIATSKDLLNEKVRLVQANPDAAAVGKVVREVFLKNGQWETLRRRTLVFEPTVSDVANVLKVGTADAGFVWDATVRQYPELEAVLLPDLAGASGKLAAAVLRSSQQPTAALHFARYLAARDKGLPHFAALGVSTVEGDAWTDVPELRLLAGAMLRPAVEETIAAFERREGVTIVRVYNGCGILVAQMRTGDRPPDAYFACDKSFMNQVSDLFLDPVSVSANQLVILVPKGNPHGIRSLRDLGKPGLRVGVGHEKQCALGTLTQETLRQGKALAEVMKNVKVQTPTGDMLVNQLRTGSLDAVVAYLSNATEAAEELQAIAIDVPCAVAVQPVAVAKGSANRYLAGRLVDTLRSAASRERFEAFGFTWQDRAK
jgi:molybdenum ABC transporter molybdate-binding protein